MAKRYPSSRTNFRRTSPWIIVGGAICLSVFLLLSPAAFRKDGTLKPVASSPATQPYSSIDDRSDNHQDAGLANNIAPPANELDVEKERFPSVAPTDGSTLETHRKFVAKVNATIRKRTRELYGGSFSN